MPDFRMRTYGRDPRTGARQPMEITVYREGFVICRKVRPRPTPKWKRALRRLRPGRR